MRDPNRIPVILEMIRVEWEKYPDLRLGQIISNVTYGMGCDLFHLEDGEFIKMFNKFNEN